MSVVSLLFVTFVPSNSNCMKQKKKYEMRHLPYKLYIVLDGYKSYYTDKDLTETSLWDLGDAYVFTEDEITALIRKHCDMMNFIINEDDVKFDYFNVICFNDGYVDVYADIKGDFDEAHITDYDTEQIAPLITKLLEVKRNYDGLLIAVEEELKEQMKG